MRGTQSLLYICADAWRRPGILVRELLWRWAFGIPAALIIAYQLSRVAANVPAELNGLSLTDPFQAAQQLTNVAVALKPELVRLASWLCPLLAVAWAIVSGLGRTAVLKRLDASLQRAPFTLILLQLLRIVALIAVFLGWYRATQWASNATLDSNPPNLVGWSAFVICLSLAVFVLWALLSWIFSIAPLLAMLENKGAASSLKRSFRLGPLTAKLVEVNLVLGIVRLALIVLAMVFSAIPLPFITGPSGMGLYLWWALGTLLYLVAGDFFQVVRLAAFIQFWRFYCGQQ
ncbi:MAG TPA: hypothetical protein VMB49_07565 [Acidobacteriaceae bacterium]|nr:hypothetical protein [Acidobacteriaceae bacterium]